jgi:hypothetical protein
MNLRQETLSRPQTMHPEVEIIIIRELKIALSSPPNP